MDRKLIATHARTFVENIREVFEAGGTDNQTEAEDFLRDALDYIDVLAEEVDRLRDLDPATSLGERMRRAEDAR